PGEKLGIFQVNWAVPNQLGENEIVHFQCKEAKPDELAREQFLQPLRVVFWNISHRDVLKIQSVLPVEGGALASNTLQFSGAVGRYRRNIVHIPCGSRQIVEGRKYKAAQAMHFNSNTKKLINLSQEVFPLGRQDVRGIRRHIEAPRAASCLGHSNRVLLSSDAFSAIGARSRSRALRLTVPRAQVSCPSAWLPTAQALRRALNPATLIADLAFSPAHNKSQAILQVVELGLLHQPLGVHLPVLQHEPRQRLEQPCLQLILRQSTQQVFTWVSWSSSRPQIGETRVSKPGQVG